MTEHDFRAFLSAAESKGSTVDLSPPACGSEGKIPPELPVEIRQSVAGMWAVSNGAFVAGLQFLGSDETYIYGGDLYAVQNWGSGDFDCVIFKGEDAGKACFANHQHDARSIVASSIGEWLRRLTAEMNEYGEIFHPKDFLQAPNRKGVYSRVALDLKNVNCELTRWASRQNQ